MRFLIRTLFALLIPAALLADGPLSSTTLSKVVSKSTVSVASNGSVSSPSIVFAGRGTNYGFYSPTTSAIALSLNGTQTHQFWSDGSLYLGGTIAELKLPSGGWIDWNGDTFLYRDAANTLSQRNSTTAQAYRIYNTYTDASNYERAVIDWTTTAGRLTIGSAKAGTGASKAVDFIAGGLVALTLGTAGDVQIPKTITASGTTGAQTINKAAGSVNLAASATSLVVTDSMVTTSSVIIVTVGANDTTCKSVQAVAGSGSFTIYPNAAPTSETRVNFIIVN